MIRKDQSFFEDTKRNLIILEDMKIGRKRFEEK